MGKQVAVVVRRSALNSDHNSEALRLSVGQTTGDHQVTVFFLGPAVAMLRPLNPSLVGADDVGKHIEACQMLGVRLVAEKEALGQLGISEPVAKIEAVDLQGICRRLLEADVVIPF